MKENRPLMTIQFVSLEPFVLQAETKFGAMSCCEIGEVANIAVGPNAVSIPSLVFTDLAGAWLRAKYEHPPETAHFQNGQWVMTTTDAGEGGWEDPGRLNCRWGARGTVLGHYFSHDICYDVLHPGGLVACYEQSELEPYGQIDLKADEPTPIMSQYKTLCVDCKGHGVFHDKPCVRCRGIGYEDPSGKPNLPPGVG